MKKALAVLFAALMVLAFAACQKEAPRDATDPLCAGITSPLSDNPNNYNCPTDYPAPWNVGVPAGVSLTNYAGNFTTSYDGQVIDAMLIQGNVYVRNNNVTIRRSAVYSSDPSPTAVNVQNGATGLIIEDSDIHADPQVIYDTNNGQAAVGCSNFTFRRSTVTGFGEGLCAYGNVTVEDSYLGQFPDLSSTPQCQANPLACAHQDAVQVEWDDNVTLTHNTLDAVHNDNGALWVSAGNPHNNIVADNNLLVGGRVCLGAGDNGLLTNSSYTNNRFSTYWFPTCGAQYPWQYQGVGAVYSGNVWYDGPNVGQPVQ